MLASVAALALATAALPAASYRSAEAACQVAVTLRPDDIGPDVLCLEQRLAELGFDAVDVPDEIYGTNTAEAVRAFQITRGLYPDGVAYSLTLRQLGLRGDDPTSRPVRVTLIGDSTMAAMRWYDEVNNATVRYDTLGTGYDTILSAESCRRLVATSCTGRRDPVTGERWVPTSVLPLMQSSLQGRLGEVLVVMAGYDDVTITTAIDQIMAEAMVQGVEDVFFLNFRLTNTYPAYQQYYQTHNADLLAARGRHPRLTVLDWNDYSAGRTSWFSSDGIHLTSQGAIQLGLFIRAAVDGRASQSCRTTTTTSDTPSGVAVADPGACRATRLGVVL